MLKWRTVRYTDDGCSLYQCLSCKEQWEARSAPGWFSTTADCDPGTPDARKCSDGTYYVPCTPRYIPCWKHCPYCGVVWTGPLRCDVDNERMLGERRQRIEKAFENIAYGRWSQPDYLIVIQQQAARMDPDDAWFTIEYYDPNQFKMSQILQRTKKLRREEADNCKGLECLKPDRFRVRIKKTDPKNYQPTRSYI